MDILSILSTGNGFQQTPSRRRRAATWLGALLLLNTAAMTASGAPLYWDTNGATPGAGATPSGTWGSNAFWNSDATGGGAGAFQSTTLLADDLHFVAGPANGSGSSAYTVDVSGVQSANLLVFQSSGAITLTGARIQLGAGGINALQHAYATVARAQVDIDNEVELQASASITNSHANNAIWLNGAISESAAGYSITKNGSGRLNLLGANTFSGGVTLNAGSLSLRHADALGTGTLQINAGTISISNTVVINGNAQIWNGNFSVGTYSGPQNIGTGAVLLTGDRSVGVAAYQTFIVGGVISDGGTPRVLSKTGEGTIRLNGANTFSGGFTLEAGDVIIGNASALGTGTLTINGGRIVTAGTTLNGNAQRWAGDFSVAGGTGTQDMGTGAVLLQGGTRSVTINGGQTFSVGGSINAEADGDGLNKLGTGHLILKGENAYTGDTTLEAGTLTLSEEGSFRLVIGANGLNNRIINTAGTLNLNGSFAFDLQNAATHAGASWSIVSGAANYGATFEVAGFSSLDGNLWERTYNGAVFQFNESTGSLSVAAIPEPSSVLLGCGAALLLYGLRRRNARSVSV